jgi:DNA-binding PadR family transcriptional regulator
LEPGERVDIERDPESSGGGGTLKSEVACAVLGLVIEKPSYGYEIWQRFDPRFGGFLQAGKSMIYSVLTSLAAAGLIEEMVGIESVGVKRGAKPGPSYRATRQGARAYRRRVAERLRGDPQRAEMLGRLVLAGINGIEAALELLDRYEEQCLLELQEMAPPAPNAPWRARSEVSRLVERLILEEGRRTIDAQLKWVDYARAELRAFAGDGVLAGDDPHEGKDPR